MKKLILSIFLLAVAIFTNAQIITKEVIAKCPELEVGKIYTGKDVRNAKSNFAKGIYIVGDGTDKYYPFAKITGKKSTVIFLFEDPYEGDIIYMHGYLYSSKEDRLERVQTHIYADGKINSTTYEGTIKVNENQEVFVKTITDGKLKTGKYLFTRKGFTFGEWIYD